jgi:hypothetical protein
MRGCVRGEWCTPSVMINCGGLALPRRIICSTTGGGGDPQAVHSIARDQRSYVHFIPIARTYRAGGCEQGGICRGRIAPRYRSFLPVLSAHGKVSPLSEGYIIERIFAFVTVCH